MLDIADLDPGIAAEDLQPPSFGAGDDGAEIAGGAGGNPLLQPVRPSSAQTESFERINMLDKQKVRACAVSEGERSRL
jgi:hypothetical protein